MLYHLAMYFLPDWEILRIFRYTTFRGVMAALTAMLLCIYLGPWTVKKLLALKLQQPWRKYTPDEHTKKVGTPTMGGILIIFGISVGALVWCRLDNYFVWILLFVMLSTGAIGFYDDWLKVTRQNSDGVSGRFKLFWQLVIALVVSLFLFYYTQLPATTEFIVPFFKHIQYPLGVVGFCAVSCFVIIGTSNAVNLTDGLDGLASLPVVMVGAGLGVFAYASGHSVFAHYLQIPYIPNSGEVMIFCCALAGSTLGFLWWNAPPAKMFMGDVGSLSLGALLGTMAIIVRQEIVLAIMGGIFVAEAMSVMLQVASYRYRHKKRIWAMTPIHHHFEKRGEPGTPWADKEKWTQTQIVVRFWIITMVLVLIGLSTLKLR